MPVKIEPESPQMELLLRTAEENGVDLKLYGSESDTLYLRFDQLSDKQTIELLGKKLMTVLVHFEATGTYKVKDGGLGLRLRVTKLQKVRVAERQLDPAPED